MVEIKYTYNGDEIKVGKVYKFKVSNREFIGRLVSIKTDEIVFDCSEKYDSCIRTYKLWQVGELQEIN